MKKIIFLLVLAALFAAAFLYLKKRSSTPEKPIEEKPPEIQKVTHDESGRVVLHMEDEIQGNIGLLVAKPAAGSLASEVKGYGKVLDAASFTGLVNELASARAASVASSNELARLKTLVAQGNVAERAVQTAEAAALKDQLAIQSAHDRLTLAWGAKLSAQQDLAALGQALNAQKNVLLRVDLPVGEKLDSEPSRARLFTLGGKEGEAEYLSPATTVDPTTLSRGYLFLVKSNSLGLVAGEPVIAYLQTKAEPITGAIILRDSVVRAEGMAWVYVFNKGGESFTRTSIALDHPVNEGWLVEKGVFTNDNVVVDGAQTLLSEEQKAAIKAD